MTLLRRIIVEKRPIVAPLLVALAVNAAVYVLVVYPKSTSQAGAEHRANDAALALKAAEREEAAARDLVSGKGRAQQELATFYSRVLPADLGAARRMTYAALPALAQKTDVVFGGRRTEIDTDRGKDARFGRLQIRMVLQGDYEHVRQFIYELESAPEFVIIDDVTLAQSDASKPLTLTLQLSAYYRRGPNGA